MSTFRLAPNAVLPHASASLAQVFDKLLTNTISRFNNDHSAVYKELLDLHDDHFKLDVHQIDHAVQRLGDQHRSLVDGDPYVLAMRMVAGGHRRTSLFFDACVKPSTRGVGAKVRSLGGRSREATCTCFSACAGLRIR